ncbi:hypothetical protein M422DRAFT_28296, partial [Sphaerobolus stellatus SS14]
MTNHGLPNESPFRSYVVSELSISHIKCRESKMRCEANRTREELGEEQETWSDTIGY